MRQVKEIRTLINYFKNSVLISLCFDEEIFIMVFESKLSEKKKDKKMSKEKAKVKPMTQLNLSNPC